MIRTTLLALTLAAAITGCAAKKKPAATPANAAPETGSATAPGEGGMKDEKTPDDPDQSGDFGADPCDGGE